MAININTTSQQYQNYLNGLDNIRDYYTPKLILFKKLSASKQKIWLQKDPLLKKLFQLSLDMGRYIEMVRGE